MSTRTPVVSSGTDRDTVRSCRVILVWMIRDRVTSALSSAVEMRLALAGALVVLLAAGCSVSPSPGETVSASPSRPERPHDPWVFRAVLDQRPRMLVVALREDLWLAYDGTTGGLASAMSRPVSFEGAVYTGGHGPQPTTQPPNYEQHEPGATGWTVTDPQGGTHGVRLLGYRLDGARSVTLRWGMADSPDGVRVEIVEAPHALPGEGAEDGVAWHRSVAVTGLPAGWTATLRFGEAVPGRTINDMQQCLAAPMPDQVTWEADGQARLLIAYDPLPVQPDAPADAAPEAKS